MKKVDFSETVAASDLKVSWSRHLNEYIEDIQIFLLNMAFISSSEVKNVYISFATNEIYIFFTSQVK